MYKQNTWILHHVTSYRILYTKFARKCPNFTLCLTKKYFSGIFFFLGGEGNPFPPSPTPMAGPQTPHQLNPALGRGDNISITFGWPDPKIWEDEKTSKIQRDFWQLSTLIANISRMTPDIQNLKGMWSTAIPPAFHQKSPVNFGPQTKKVLLAKIEPPKWIFWGTLYFSP